MASGDSNPPSAAWSSVPINVDSVQHLQVADRVVSIGSRDQSRVTGPVRRSACQTSGGHVGERQLDCTLDTELVQGRPCRFIQTDLNPTLWVGPYHHMIVANEYIDVSYHLNTETTQRLLEKNCSPESVQGALGQCLAALEWSSETILQQKLTAFKLKVLEEEMPRLLQTVLELITNHSSLSKLICLVKQAFRDFGAQLKAVKLSSLVFLFQHTDEAKADEMLGSVQAQGKLIGLLYQFLPEWVRVHAQWEVECSTVADCGPMSTWDMEPAVIWRMPVPSSPFHNDSQIEGAVDMEMLTHLMEPVINRSIERAVNTFNKAIAPLQSTIDHVYKAILRQQYAQEEKYPPDPWPVQRVVELGRDSGYTDEGPAVPLSLTWELEKAALSSLTGETDSKSSAGLPVQRTESPEEFAQVISWRSPTEHSQEESEKLPIPILPKHLPEEDFSRTVQVSGGDIAIDEDMMMLYFENTRKSGGGPIRKMEVRKDTGMTLITFEEQTAAERVVKRLHRVAKTLLNVVPYRPVARCTKVRVKGLTSRVSEELLQMYFAMKCDTENPEVQMIADKGEAIVEFHDPKVVQNVLARSHTIGGKLLTVVPETTTPKGSTIPVTSPQTYTVEVRGLAPFATEDMIWLYFENSRRSGGGEVEDVQYVRGSDVAQVTFHEKEAMTRVLEKQHRLQGHTLQVSEATPHGPSVPASPTSTAGKSTSGDLTTVSVRGLPVTASLDTVAFYFENRKRSGGGDVQEVRLDERSGIFFVTFENHEDAARVAARSHTLAKHKLDVRLEEPRKPYADRVQLKNLPPLQTRDELLNFVEAKTGHFVETVLFGDTGDTAVIIFESPIDFRKVRAALTNRPFKGHKLMVDTIPQSSTILVKNPPASEDHLQFYLERHGEISAVKTDKDRQYALVTFIDPEVALKVSAGQNYKLEGRPLEVSLYMECLGVSGGSLEPTASPRSTFV